MDWVKNNIFFTFLQQNTSKKSIDRLTLFGLMVKPIQRFPQFIMLIKVRQPTDVKVKYLILRSRLQNAKLINIKIHPLHILWQLMKVNKDDVKIL